MRGNEYFKQVSACFKYWSAFLIFWVSLWMTWQEANGSWNALTLAKGISPCRDQLVFQQSTTTLLPMTMSTPMTTTALTSRLHLPRGMTLTMRPLPTTTTTSPLQMMSPLPTTLMTTTKATMTMKPTLNAYTIPPLHLIVVFCSVVHCRVLPATKMMSATTMKPLLHDDNKAPSPKHPPLHLIVVFCRGVHNM